MIDSERLEKVRKYVEGMFPVVRAAILRTHDEQLRDQGYDEAIERTQQNLLRILND